MSNYQVTYTAHPLKSVETEDLNTAEDYTAILNAWHIPFVQAGKYLQVGEVPAGQGWVLHLSGILSQLPDLFLKTLPFLAETSVPFKLVSNKEIARLTLFGKFGYTELGKLISIYPSDTNTANQLANQLIQLTSAFNGPAILAAAHLGGVLYASYEQFQPTSSNNESMEHQWPFTNIQPPESIKPSKLLHHIYKPIALLKQDLKGDVIKALYAKNLFWAKPCVIKEARAYMVSDEYGRDMRDRLLWQQKVHQQLADIVPLPKVIDLFEERGNTYLAMEWIEGRSLFEIVLEKTDNCSWISLPIKEKIELLDYLLQLVNIIQDLHNQQYVHRDITPANFLITARKEIYLIDLELSYSLKNIDAPPYKLGTPGFASPEQENAETPTIQEDIYGLGATMLFFFSGLFPVKFNKADTEALQKSIHFFTGSYLLSNLVSNCLQSRPTNRPPLSEIKTTLNQYRKTIRERNTFKDVHEIPVILDKSSLQRLLQDCINGLGSEPLVSSKQLWGSLPENQMNYCLGYEQIERSYRTGFGIGMAGIMYTLATVKSAGYNIDPCLNTYHNSWKFLQQEQLSNISQIPRGLYEGTAGTALAIASGIDAGLLFLTETNKTYLHQCFEQLATDYVLSSGVTGQGLALLRCSHLMEASVTQNLLKKYTQLLLDAQQPDGSWPVCLANRREEIIPGLANGVAGITLFFLAHIAQYPSVALNNAARKALAWLLNLYLKRKDTGNWPVAGMPKQVNLFSVGTGAPGIALTFIKAWQVLNDPVFKRAAEEILLAVPTQSVYEEYTLYNGLSGLGEVYIAAYEAFKDKEWQQRSHWIAGLLQHTALPNEKKTGYYWSINSQNNITADLLTGNAGILHFLLQYLHDGHLNYSGLIPKH